VRYVCEGRPGLDWARNRGAAEAHYDIIAYTDDDTRADRLWLKAMALAFAKPEVMAMTGFIAPMELETAAQIYFEHIYGGMGKGFRRWEVRRSELKKHQLLWSSSFGAGANMAFRRAIFEKIGFFDVALDVGTPTRGGGDLEFFHRVVASGYTLVYEPGAMVWHQHRRDFDSLRCQLRDNGCGFGSYLMTCWRNRTVSRRAVLRFFLQNWLYEWFICRLRLPKGHSRPLVMTELRGKLQSPSAYKKAQMQASQLTAHLPKKRATDLASDTPSPNGSSSALVLVVEQDKKVSA
jgi:cellulose synthase/poly-beta-1,6-N-acetylglucosamine synthase-like glycosyltransferase